MVPFEPEARPVPRMSAELPQAEKAGFKVPGLAASLKDLLKGNVTPLSPSERFEVWSRTLGWDLAVVFPNPTWTKREGHERCLHFFSWHGMDRTPQQEGISSSGARRVFRTLLRASSEGGFHQNVADEAAFLKAFAELRPCVDGLEASRDSDLRCVRLPEADAERPFSGEVEDMLSLVRNTVAAKLLRQGLSLELVLSEDKQHIYMLIGGSEVAFEGLARELRQPISLDLASLDPEAFEPCDRNFDRLTEDGEHHEAMSYYKSVRQTGASASAAIRKVNETPGTWGSHLHCAWEWLGMERPIEVIRARCLEADATADTGKWRKAMPQSAAGAPLESTFGREDRLLIVMGALEMQCDAFGLMKEGYVTDVMPCPRPGDNFMASGVFWQNRGPGLEGEAAQLHFAFCRHLRNWLAFPALLGLCLRVGWVMLPEPNNGDALLVHALLLHIFFSACLAVWRWQRRQMLLQWGVLPELPSSSSKQAAFLAGRCSGFWRREEVHPAPPAPLLRAKFKGTCHRSPLSSLDEEFASSAWLQALRQSLSIAVCSTLGLGCLALAGYIASLIDFFGAASDTPGYNFAQNIVAAINAAQVTGLNFLLKRAAKLLTHLENHRTHAEFVRAYLMKAWCLQLVNSSASLFCIAFVPFADGLYSGLDSLRGCNSQDVQSRSYMDHSVWWRSWAGTCAFTQLDRQLMTLMVAFILQSGVRDCLAPLIWSHELQNRLELRSSASAGGEANSVDAVARALEWPRLGDPEVTRNGAPGCSGELVQLVMLLLFFATASPYSGLLALICGALRFFGQSFKLQQLARRLLPWPAAGAAAVAQSEVLEPLVLQGVCIAAVPLTAALLAWPADLASHTLVLTILGQSYAGNGVAAWVVYALLLSVAQLLAAFLASLPGRRLTLVEARLRRAMELAPVAKEIPSSVKSTARPVWVGDRRTSDYRVHSPGEWRKLCAEIQEARPVR